MATYEELMAKSRELYGNGDMAGAKRVAEIAVKRRGGQQYDAMGFPAQPAGGSSANPQAVGEFRDKGRALGSGIANGMSAGFGDNIAGVVGGLNYMMDGQGFQRGYKETLGQVREGMAADKAANPGITTAGNIIGATVPALAAAPFATGAGVLGTGIRSGIIGGVEGALQGAGNADGQDVGSAAGWGGLFGLGLGVAAPAVVGAAGAVKNAVMDPVSGVFDSLVGRANSGKANRAIGGALQSSGKKQQDIIDAITRAGRDGQPEYRLMDALGVPGQRQASGVARAGGDAAAEITEFLEKRQMGQGERVGSFVEDAFGVRGTTAAQTRDGLIKSRGDAANTAYDAARGNAAPVDIRGALGAIDSRIGGMQGSGVAGDGIDGKLASYRSRLAAQPGPDGVSRELSDFDRVLGVKQSVQDDIGAAIRAGRNNEARELGKLASELDAALEGASDMYRTANDGFREASRVIGAVDDGAAMSARGRAADNVPAFQSMNPDMQGAARIGYGDDLMARLERITAPTANRAKPLQSMKRDAEAQAMATDPRLYSDRLARENDMWTTQNRALGGSRTADNIADQGAVSDLAGGALDVARSAGNLQFGDVTAKIAGMLGPMAKGQNEATRQLIAKALMSDDPAKALAPALRQQSQSASKRRIIEGLLRQIGHQGIDK